MKNEEEPVDLFILFYTHTALVCDIFPTLPLQSENKLNPRKNRQSQIQPLKSKIFSFSSIFHVSIPDFEMLYEIWEFHTLSSLWTVQQTASEG